MSRKKVYLITGASGFIGANLLRRLVTRNECVHIILRKEAKLWRIQDLLDKATVHEADLLDALSLRKIAAEVKPSVIYHLAAYGAYSQQSEPDKIIKVNILGTWNLLQAVSAIDYGLFVNTGSSSEYGFKKLAMKEADLLEPVSFYAVAKSSATLLCSYLAQSEKKPIVTLRPFSVYGPYEEPTRFIPVLLKALYYKEPLSLVSSEVSRDQIYIDDVVDFYLLVDKLKQYPGEIFNLGTGTQSSIKKVVETAIEVTGKTTDFKWGAMKPRIWDTTNWVADISKAKELLGWAPRINLEKGLLLTWKWFESHKHLYADKLEIKNI